MKPVMLICASLGLVAAMALSANGALADSGQLRDPTRCGQGPANCRKLPPSGLQRNAPSLHDTIPKKRPDRQPLMHTSPLPSELILRKPPAPSSTGLDKGSTGLSPQPGGGKPHMNH